ncbi:MAG: glutathione synthase [Acidiferrobacteraceae bacterium]
MRVGVVMDPIESLHLHKDSTIAMLHACARRGWACFYLEPMSLVLRHGEPEALGRAITVLPEQTPWYRLGPRERLSLAGLDVLLMRKDPPIDAQYLYTTYLLEAAEERGVLVVNRPASLRNFNEKLFAMRFPDLIPPTLVACMADELRGFLAAHRDIILKPLGGMGGQSVFRLRENDPNVGVVIETLTANGRRHAMAQRFVPEIALGDKRILVIDGEPVPYALARVPAPGESRGNLAAGGHGEGRPLSERDRAICRQVGPVLRKHGILFAGLDVIGDYLTEINITSPTCIRELDRIYNLDIAGQVMDTIAARTGAQRNRAAPCHDA